MKTLNRWTSEEVQTLKTYAKEGIEVLKKKFPNRSVQALRTKCCYLNLDVGNVYTVKERLFMV